MPGAAPSPEQPSKKKSDIPVIRSLRWVLTLADGRQTEVRRPLPETAVNGQDWFSLAVPLSALKFPSGGGLPAAKPDGRRGRVRPVLPGRHQGRHR